VAQGEGLEFKSQYCKKIKKERNICYFYYLKVNFILQLLSLSPNCFLTGAHMAVFTQPASSIA
jgi:hypothetical protein